MLEVELAQRAPIALDVRLHCAADELLALVGPSGSGKTSVLRAIAGLLDPAHGSVRLGDETWLDTAAGIHVPAERRQIGMVFQNYALFPHLSARENIRLAAPRGSPPDLPDRLLDELRLAGLAHRKPHELSGGQRQRVALARAMARQPKLLLLDEAFSAVDHPTRMALYEELVALRSRVRLPIILVTHDLREARELADTICIMDAGETLQSAAPERVMARPRNARVAALVGIRDIQPGVFRTHSSGNARLVWGHEGDELSLIVRDKGRIADGTRVHWVIAGQFVHLTRAQPTGPNAVECEIDTVKALGALSTMVCRPVQAPDMVVHVDTTTTLLRTLQIRLAERVHLQLESEGIHIMPVKDVRS